MDEPVDTEFVEDAEDIEARAAEKQREEGILVFLVGRLFGLFK